MRARPLKFTRGAIILHWASAALIAFNLAVGWWMEDIAEPYRTIVVRLHQSSGMTVLALTVLRILWRLVHRPPPLDPDLSSFERVTARSVHAMLYIAMLALPLSGWALISANPPRYEVAHSPALRDRTHGPDERHQRYVMLWGAVPLHPIARIQDIAARPNGIVDQQELHKRIVAAHSLAGYMMLALLALHILGALKHQWVDGKAELSRMGIGRQQLPNVIDP